MSAFLVAVVGAVLTILVVGSSSIALAGDGIPVQAQTRSQEQPEIRQPEPVPGELVGVPELLADPTRYDGLLVTVEGELVGDYGFRRDGYMWTQLNDDAYARAAIVDGGPRDGSNIAIGVRMPTGLGTDLDPPGGYRLEGPLVLATGIWRYHDPDRGGETFLDIEAVDVLEAGRRLEEGPDWVVMGAGAVLLMISGAMWLRRPAVDA